MLVVDKVGPDATLNNPDGTPTLKLDVFFNSVLQESFGQAADLDTLVDLVNDPHELVNLAEDAKYRGRKWELAAELANWMARHDDRFHSFKTTPLAGPRPRRTRRVPANPPANR